MNCYFCNSQALFQMTIGGETFYECLDCQHLTDVNGKQVKSVMEDLKIIEDHFKNVLRGE